MALKESLAHDRVYPDFRAVLAQVLCRTQGLNRAQLDALFPGYAWDQTLDGLMRA